MSASQMRAVAGLVLGDVHGLAAPGGLAHPPLLVDAALREELDRRAALDLSRHDDTDRPRHPVQVEDFGVLPADVVEHHRHRQLLEGAEEEADALVGRDEVAEQLDEWGTDHPASLSQRPGSGYCLAGALRPPGAT